MRKLRLELQQAYEQALLHQNSYELAVAKDACELAWKSCYYRPIEEFRARIKIASQSVSQARESNLPSLEEIESQQHKLHLAFIKFLDESCASYRLLIWKLDKIYGNDSQEKAFELSSREVEKAKGSLAGLSRSPSSPPSLPCLLHRCLVYLGDLYRYKANAQSSIPSGQQSGKDDKSDSWLRAIRSYQCAASLYPSSGNPFNQLAVMSYQAGDEMRAVVFYFRSLKVSQPFVTARQNLLLLFEKNRARFSQLHNAIKARTEARATTLSDVSVTFVRLNGLFFDKINAQEYTLVKNLAFTSLNVLLGSHTFLPTLSQSMAFDHLPLHLSTLATFSAHCAAPQPVMALIELIITLLNASTALTSECNEEHRMGCARLSAGALVSIQLIGCNPQEILQPLLDQIDATTAAGRSDSEAFELSLKLLDAGMKYARSVPVLYASTPHSNDASDSMMLLPENKELIGFEPLRMVWEKRQALCNPSHLNATDRDRVKQLLQLLKWLGQNIQTSLSSSIDISHRTVRVRVSCQQLVEESESGLLALDGVTSMHQPPLPPPHPHQPNVDDNQAMGSSGHKGIEMAMELIEDEEEVVVWQPRGAAGQAMRSSSLSPPLPHPPPRPPPPPQQQQLAPPPPPLPTLLLSNMQPHQSSLIHQLQHIEAVSERHLEAIAFRVKDDLFSSEQDASAAAGHGQGGGKIHVQLQKDREDFSFLGMFAVPHNS